MGFLWVIFERGEYIKPMGFDGWVFKGGSTQNRWLSMGDFSKGGVHKTNGLWWVSFQRGSTRQNENMKMSGFDCRSISRKCVTHNIFCMLWLFSLRVCIDLLPACRGDIWCNQSSINTPFFALRLQHDHWAAPQNIYNRPDLKKKSNSHWSEKAAHPKMSHRLESADSS